MSDINDADFQLHGIRDPRVAVHATSSLPAWIWSLDGARILWANIVGVRLFGESNAAALAAKTIRPPDPHRRQAAQLAARLAVSGAPRLERLRGFGAPLGRLLTCSCARLTFPDGSAGILIAATEPVGRAVPLTERLAHLVDSITMPAMTFTPNGALAGANEAAKRLPGLLKDLTGPGFDDARKGALRNGQSILQTRAGRITVHRVGGRDETALVALIDAVILPKPERAGLASGTPELTGRHATEDAQAEAPIRTAAEARDQITEPTASGQTASGRRASAPAHDAPFTPPQHPLRFMWHTDENNRFSLGFDEFSRLIGARTASAFGRPWSEISDALNLDPEGRVATAIATRETWGGIVVNWPTDDDDGRRLPVEMSGLPVYDRNGQFFGYRGFGVCHDVEGMAQLAAQRHDDLLTSSRPPASVAPGAAALQDANATRRVTDCIVNEGLSDPGPSEVLGHAAAANIQDNVPSDMRLGIEQNPVAEPSQNVVPFPGAEPRSPALTAVESNAFDELARRLSARLENAAAGMLAEASATEPFAADGSEPPREPIAEPAALDHSSALLDPEPVLPRTNAAQDARLLDRVPVGVLVYRLDRLIYANKAFLESTGYDSLHALTEAGGLNALAVEAGAGSASSTSEAGTPVVIAATGNNNRGEPADARLFAVTWDDEPAHALVLSGPRHAPPTETAPDMAAVPAAVGDDDTTQAEELGTILDHAAEGILVFDDLGRILSCNRSAEMLFGRDDDEMAALNLTDLFTADSQRAVQDYVNDVRTAAVPSLLDHDRDTMGRARDGSGIPLSMTLGRTRPGGTRFFAILRQRPRVTKDDDELLQARRQAERATTARADILGRISHEVRMPLNAILGFADVMIEERFGALGNERYVEYMKDIRASGQRVMAIIDDLLDLSRIETGKIELSFASQDLNGMIEQCVAVMQPQANRERIIIRTSLAHALPTVKADARALRQIVLNLIGNSIHLANAGGQVIVSTATTDFGDIVLRVRDTGPGLNDNEIAAAMAPFHTATPSDHSADDAVVNLSLTKALVEANRAQFHIKTAPHSGTLIEVVFSHASAIA